MHARRRPLLVFLFWIGVVAWSGGGSSCVVLAEEDHDDMENSAVTTTPETETTPSMEDYSDNDDGDVVVAMMEEEEQDIRVPVDETVLLDSSNTTDNTTEQDDDDTRNDDDTMVIPLPRDEFGVYTAESLIALQQTIELQQRHYQQLQPQKQQQTHFDEDETTTKSNPSNPFDSVVCWMVLLENDSCAYSLLSTVQAVSFEEDSRHTKLHHSHNHSTHSHSHHHHHHQHQHLATSANHIHKGRIVLDKAAQRDVREAFGIPTLPAIVVVTATVPTTTTTTTPSTNHSTTPSNQTTAETNSNATTESSNTTTPPHSPPPPIPTLPSPRLFEYTGLVSPPDALSHGVRHLLDTIVSVRHVPVFATVRDALHAASTTATTRSGGLTHSPLHRTARPALSMTASDRERTALAFVWPAAPPVRVLIQCRRSQTTTTPREKDTISNSDSNTATTSSHPEEPEGTDQKNDTVAAHPQYYAFDQMAWTLLDRHDRWLVSVTDCDDDLEDDLIMMDGGVQVWHLPAVVQNDNDNNHDHDRNDNHRRSDPVLRHVYNMAMDPDNNNGDHTDDTDDDDLQKKESSRFVEFLLKASTDSLLWYDHQTVAPIAFSKHRKIHAVLFLNLVYSGDDARTQEFIEENNRAAVEQLDDACHAQEELHSSNSYDFDILEHDMVCLVVPSTEMRVWLTFGLDPWSDYSDDPKDMDDADDGPANLPTLLVTDQRYTGTLQYRTTINTIAASTPVVTDFLTDFWQDRLSPDLRSSPRGPRTNQAGVRSLTTKAMPELLSAPHHSLLVLTAPTCGHCQRFLVLYNRLARLFRHIGWDDSFVQLYQLDVTVNDIMTFNLTARHLPDVYYRAPTRESAVAESDDMNVDESSSTTVSPPVFVRYNHTDALGDGVGGIKDHMDILDWLIHEVKFVPPEEKLELAASIGAMLLQHAT